MSRRIEIELTSSRPDGSWTWRAAGAREPKGVLDGTLLSQGSKPGDVVKAEAEFDIDGITIVSITQGRVKVDKVEKIVLVGNDKPFEAVTQQLAKKDRGDRRDRGDRGDRRDRPARGDRPARDGAARDTDRRPRRDNAAGGDKPRGPRRPHFEAPPELPQRPKAKRLKAGSTNRKAVLSELPEDQRPIAELALQGMQTVRQRLKDANAALTAEGKPTMPEQSVLQMAENLLPRLRVADWLDRAEAARKDLADLDLRDLRSVVAAANDPVIERAENCRELVAELRAGLTSRAEQEHLNWLGDIDAALGVGRIVRALKLSGQPPKAGALFPDELGRRLAEATSQSLVADALADRWIAVLEAVAFAPIRAQVTVTSKPETISPDLAKTVERLGALLPQIATALGITVASSNHAPKPLRAVRPPVKKLPPKPPTAPKAAVAPEATPAVAEAPAEAVTEVPESVVTESIATESPANDEG